MCSSDLVLSPAWYFAAARGLALILVVMTIAGYSVLLERKASAWIQGRVGPNRTSHPLISWIPFLGAFLMKGGFIQPAADGLKFLFKEDALPGHVNRFYFLLAPVVAMIPALTTVTTVPFGAYLDPQGKVIPLGLANLDLGILAVFAVSSLGV